MISLLTLTRHLLTLRNPSIINTISPTDRSKALSVTKLYIHAKTIYRTTGIINGDLDHSSFIGRIGFIQFTCDFVSGHCAAECASNGGLSRRQC